MIVIRKDGHRRRVTQHAFDVKWRQMGYEIVEEKPLQNAVEEPEPVTQDEPKTLENMTVAELREYAESHNVDLSGTTRKDDIIAAIQAAGAGF